MSLKSIALSVLANAGAVQAAGAQTLLDPIKPLLTPDSAMAKNPLGHLGANGPWQPGPDVYGISSDVPEGCVVDQAAYISRHGSRYPDPGAHAEWLGLVQAFNSSKYKATGPLSFIHDWNTPLSDPGIQIAQVSKTGYKELFDMGYTLRIRYPDLYREGEDFYVWANKYPRVLQTAELFVQGFLGANSSLGTVVSVAGKGFPEYLGDTLAPSDMCPTFVDDSSKQTTAWQSKWLPDFKARLSKYVKGDLNLTDSQWVIFPYICGFESQIRGRMSPFCDTFNEKELEQYEYQQDLRYYYGVGPVVNVASKMMVPYLDALMQRFVAGPDAEGTTVDGGKFKVPKLLMTFLNDGQLNQLAVASGIFDDQKPLPTDKIAKDRLWRSSRISPMRGTIAFERLTCGGSLVSSAPGKPSPRPPQVKDSAFVRIRLNDAVYPLPSCQDGPGKSCSVRKYSDYVAKKLEKQGSFAKICNATDPATPTKVAGASFFTNLAQSHLELIKV